MLVFYAGLRPLGFRGERRLYIIGYFTLASVESIHPTNCWPPNNVGHLMRNAHLRRSQLDPGLVVARGNPGSSRLLRRAIGISDEEQNSTPEFQRRTGIRGSLMRAIGRWVSSENAVNFIEWISRESDHDS